MIKKEKVLEILDNKSKGKKQELIGKKMRQINICEKVNKDRAWQISNMLTKIVLENKKRNHFKFYII